MVTPIDPAADPVGAVRRYIAQAAPIAHVAIHRFEVSQNGMWDATQARVRVTVRHSLAEGDVSVITDAPYRLAVREVRGWLADRIEARAAETIREASRTCSEERDELFRLSLDPTSE